jgi:hypothetical protein
VKALAILVALVGLSACGGDCSQVMAEYMVIKASPASPAEIEAAWLKIPLWCEGRPDKP